VRRQIKFSLELITYLQKAHPRRVPAFIYAGADRTQPTFSYTTCYFQPVFLMLLFKTWLLACWYRSLLVSFILGRLYLGMACGHGIEAACTVLDVWVWPAGPVPVYQVTAMSQHTIYELWASTGSDKTSSNISLGERLPECGTGFGSKSLSENLHASWPRRGKV